MSCSLLTLSSGFFGRTQVRGVGAWKLKVQWWEEYGSHGIGLDFLIVWMLGKEKGKVLRMEAPGFILSLTR